MAAFSRASLELMAALRPKRSRAAKRSRAVGARPFGTLVVPSWGGDRYLLKLFLGEGGLFGFCGLRGRSLFFEGGGLNFWRVSIFGPYAFVGLVDK